MTADKNKPPGLVLASSSKYRAELLNRLEIRFQAFTPDIDESPHDNEVPECLAGRLAESKARAGAVQYPDALIIGSDQVAILDGQVIGKPGTHTNAVKQLMQASGQTMHFLTALCLFNSSNGRIQTDVVPFSVHFRPLSEAMIEDYLKREHAYDCAGAFKSEGLGIALVERFEGDDPTALIGLPLIRLCEMLAEENFPVINV